MILRKMKEMFRKNVTTRKVEMLIEIQCIEIFTLLI